MVEPVVLPAPTLVSSLPDSADFCLKTRYKSLVPPPKAKEELHNQLRQAFGETVVFADALVKLLVELGPAFWKGVVAGELPKYEVWLVHGHYNLKPDEKMVSHRDGELDIMQPMNLVTERVPLGSRLVAERWDHDEQALEHRIVDDDETFPSPPPKELWDGFRRVMGKYNITALGVSVAPATAYRRELLQRWRFVERTGFGMPSGRVGDRKHVTTWEYYPDRDNMFQVAWLPINPNPVTSSWLRSTTGHFVAASALSVPDPNTTDEPKPDSNTTKDDILSTCCTHICQEQSCECVVKPD